ncbi:MAG TPA: ABC transporter permease [Anaerolineaceae bacterium]|nr:ABC transporter permease [Anaerolineaceae bacterium]
MNKIMLVAQYEYKRHVYRRGFWVAMFAVPIGILLMMGLSMFFSFSAADKRPIGIVDEPHLIKTFPVYEKVDFFSEPEPEFKSYPDNQAARAALDAGEIQAYASIPTAYTSTYQVDYLFDKPITSSIQVSLSKLLRDNLMQDKAIPNLAAIERGTEFTFQSMDGTKTSSEYDWLKIIIPIAAGLLYFITVMTSGGYLLRAIVEEKENRTMEMMITSTSPTELIGGKIFGDMGVGLTQMGMWVLMLGVGAFIFRDKLTFLSHINLDWRYAVITLLFMLIGYVFICALMGMMGATITSTQESQQFMGLIVMPMMLPYYLASVFITSSNSIIPRILSFFPLSAPLAIPLRMGFGAVPTWEIVVSLVILLAFGIGTIWMAGKAFRIGMLSYEQKVPLKRLFQKEASHE